MFLPVILDRFNELYETSDLDAAEWLGKLTSRTLLHLADLSQNTGLPSEPARLKEELLKRLHLEGYDDLFSISNQGARLEVGVNAWAARQVYAKLVERAIASAA